MGWTEKLPSGKTRAGYRDDLGRKHQATFLHDRAAKRWLRDQEDALARGLDPDAGKLLMSDWIKRWQAARVVAKVTAYNEAGRVQAVTDEFGTVALERMSTLEIQGWLKRLTATGLGNGTVRLYQLTISTILKAAVQERLIPDNPARFVQLPPAPRHREVYLTPAEVEAVAAKMGDEPYASMVLVQPYLGLRWGELAGLRVSDLDMLRRTAQVRQVIAEVKGERTVKPYPKTAGSFRTIPIPPRAADVLAAYLAEHPRERDQLVFVVDSGRPVSRIVHARKFKEALTLAKVAKDARPHDLRHSGASWLAQAGVPIFAISKWLGHTSIQTTMRYSHAVEGAHDDVRKAMDVLSRGTDRGTDFANG